jgi:hypothetical protein
MAAKTAILYPIVMKLSLLSAMEHTNMPANFEQNRSKKYFSHCWWSSKGMLYGSNLFQ